MQVIVASDYGSLRLARMDIPVPAPEPGELLVRVCASALNPADYKVVIGEFKFLNARNYPLVLGYDFSGTIEKTGSENSAFRAGDEVFGFLPYDPVKRRGAFGELVVARESEISRKPSAVSHLQAAAAATPGSTALQGLRNSGQLATGKNILITGASGGVGSIAIWIANASGAHVTAVGSGAGLEQARKLGASQLIDRECESVFLSEFGPFDLVFDAAAAYRWRQWSPHLSRRGAYVTTMPSLDFAVDKLTSLLTKTSAQWVQVAPRAADLEQLGIWLSSGLSIPIDRVISPGDIATGLERLRQGKVLGKIAIDFSHGF